MADSNSDDGLSTVSEILALVSGLSNDAQLEVLQIAYFVRLQDVYSALSLKGLMLTAEFKASS